MDFKFMQNITRVAAELEKQLLQLSLENQALSRRVARLEARLLGEVRKPVRSEVHPISDGFEKERKA